MGKRVKRIIGVGVTAFIFIGILLVYISNSAPEIETGEIGSSRPEVSEILGVTPTNVNVNVLRPISSTEEDLTTSPIGDSVDGDDAPVRAFPRLVKIFNGPTAGYRIGEGVVDVVEQGEGDRYKINLSNLRQEKVGGGELVKVQRAEVFSNNSTLLMYESAGTDTVIRSSFVTFDTREAESNLRTFENNIWTATNNETLLFFIRKISNQGVGIVIDVARPTDTRVVWRSGLASWLPRWGRNDFITIHSPISKITNGVTYLLDPDGDGSNVVRPFHVEDGGAGFVDGSSGYYLVYEHQSDSFVGQTYITDGDERVSIPTTLPEKCDALNAIFVCGVPNRIPAKTLTDEETIYPDSWYQGDLILNDSIILTDPLSGTVTPLLTPSNNDYDALTDGTALDVTEPKLSDDGQLFFFINKVDLSLWMLRTAL